MKKLLLLAFLLFSFLLIFFYVGLLYDKLVRPQFKNLGTEGFVFWGLFVAFLIIWDVVIIRWFIRQRKKNKTQF
ncbi:hypothetical protein [Sabulibacter ruber]|uniref:hypothetical protein n=1 Tax=Sabulibacter ruber TaxID=2811901 RepID=UPI001A96481B|nr:hypothetical protein [Sabulibacter ruber]